MRKSSKAITKLVQYLAKPFREFYYQRLSRTLYEERIAPTLDFRELEALRSKWVCNAVPTKGYSKYFAFED